MTLALWAAFGCTKGSAGADAAPPTAAPQAAAAPASVTPGSGGPGVAGPASAEAGAKAPAPRRRTVLVVGPHPDDEVMVAGGRARAAVTAGDRVKLVLVTNGDSEMSPAHGLRRQGESVAAAKVLGLSEQDVVFLGYGDQTLIDMWKSTDGAKVFTSAAGQSATYGERGLGGTDYHRRRTGSPAPYSRDALLGDLKALIAEFQPDEIYTVNDWDYHPDHYAAVAFLTEALVAVRRAGGATNAALNQSMVWQPTDCGPRYWPPQGGEPPFPPYPKPGCLDDTNLEWERIVRYPVPPEMQRPGEDRNMKSEAILSYASQASDFLLSFARKDEFFWRTDFGHDLALTARVSASSETSSWPAAKAADGFIDTRRCWVATDRAGAWIQLDWDASVRLGQVSLHGLLDAKEDAGAGRLTFSDGSAIDVGRLPPKGRVLPVTFPPKVVKWVRFTFTATAERAGLSEIFALGAPAASTANIPPHFVKGPVASPAAIRAAQTSTLSVEAHDLDGDQLQYQWIADGGSIRGSGPTATFTAPAVRAATTFTITVRISDGRGGVAENSAFVTASP